MEFELIPNKPLLNQKVVAKIQSNEGVITLKYSFNQDISLYETPTNDLWKGSCFELFIKGGSSSYKEINITPSGRANIIAFSDYRKIEAINDFSKNIKIEKEDKCYSIEILFDNISDKLINITMISANQNLERVFFARNHYSKTPDFHDSRLFIKYE